MRHTRKASLRGVGPVVERLEGRQLFAGHVLVVDIGGTIAIVGDGKANQIDVSHVAAGYVIKGLNGTKVNGKADLPLIVPATFEGRALAIALNGGDDTVTLDVTVTSLIVSLGSGNDQLIGRRIGASRDVTMLTGDGNDTVAMEYATAVSGSLTIDTGSGNDTFTGGRSFLVFQSMTVTTGSGNDSVTMLASFGNLSEGTPYVAGLMTINTGSGNDTIRLHTGLHDFDYTIGLGQLKVDTGAGNDSLSMGDYTVATYGMDIAMGAGKDTLTFFGRTQTATIKVTMGSDADVVTITGQFNLPGGPGSFDGGSGTDLITGVGNIVLLSGAIVTTTGF